MSQMSGGHSTRRESEREFAYHQTDELLPHPLNLKLYGEKKLDPKKDKDFIESIKTQGILTPVTPSQKNGGRFPSGTLAKDETPVCKGLLAFAALLFQGLNIASSVGAHQFDVTTNQMPDKFNDFGFACDSFERGEFSGRQAQAYHLHQAGIVGLRWASLFHA